MKSSIPTYQSLPRMPRFKEAVIGYLSQFILYILIVIYCILSPSLFSTIALIFMLASFGTMLATPYYLVRTNESDQSIRAIAYPLERILWATFLVINLGEFIFKVVQQATGHFDNYSDNMQKFLQIQSTEYMFVPLIQIPFIAGSILIRTQTRQLSHFKTQINKLITVPIFLVLGMLVLLIEIFSISIAGLLFFACIMVLFIQRKIDFSSYFSWVFVLLVQILCWVFIVANFLATTDLLQFESQFQIFQFYGIDGLNNFLTSPTSRGYIICLIILFIVSCLIQRIFIYHAIWLRINKQTDLSEIKHQDIMMEQGIVTNMQTTRKTLQTPLNQQGRTSFHEYELQLIADSRTESKNESNRNYGQNPRQTFRTVRSLRQSQQNREVKKKSKARVIYETFLIGINKIGQFLYSTQFSLRFCQFLSIVVIQRYNNIYSFVSLLWLTLVASTQKIRLIFYATAVILLPVQIGNYVILYVYNAAQSPLQTLTYLSPVYGFQKMQVFWLDIIIFNVYIFYLITFLLAVSRDRAQPLVRKSSLVPKPSYFILFLAFIFRHSYLLTIIAMFFLGFSKINIMNLVYVVLFLIFFSTGQDVIVEVRERNKKKITNLTTFSRKYWFIIVYFTLLCIIVKYIYFLFFTGQLTQALEPTGVNQLYQWSFNFSLSDICLSNTTPFFIIFVLSQAQIIIYRSAIYLNYSFSLVSQITELKKPRKTNFRVVMNTIAEGLLQFYYQSLYYVSGIIILACSYRWNIMGLLIVIATCYGLLRGFNRPILGFIVLVDLVFIILNYLVLFTTYQVAQQFVGKDGIAVINQIAIFLGLLTDRNFDLAGVSVINIVIFYFAVQSYALRKILQQNRFTEQSIAGQDEQQQQQQQQDNQNSKKPIEDTLSSYEPTIIQQEINDLQFARNYNKSVIMTKKRLYGTVLWKKYQWWYQICNFLGIFFTDIITVFVLVCCILFRLSVSMFYFLLLYMLYYFALFDRVGNLLKAEQFYIRMQRQFQQFKSKQKIISDQQNPRSIITGMQATESVVAFINSTKQKSIKLRYQWRERLWFLTTFVVFGCIVLTYTAQFMNSQYYRNYLNPQSAVTQTIIDVLYVLGISVTSQTSFFRQVYFYFFMVIFAIVERLLIKFIKQREQDQQLQKQPSLMTRKQYKSMQDPYNFVNQDDDFIQKIEILAKQPLQSYIVSVENTRKKSIQQQKKLKQQQIQKDFSKQSNILIYFDYKGTLIKISYMYGLLIGLLRTYLLMLLINLYEKSNIFAFFYLFAVLLFWFRKQDFSLVTGINKIAIIIVLLQYIMLLLDINTQTSPLPLPDFPDFQTLSFLETVMSGPNEQKWINYLVLDYNLQDGNSYLTSFFISAVIVFLTELYFTLFFWISKLCILMIKGIYTRYEYIGQTLEIMPQKDTIYLNYQNYKSWSYRFLTMSYELLLNNSYIVVAYLTLILLSAVHNWIAYALVVLACIYIYLGVFTGFSEDKNLLYYTKIFFRVVSAIIFIVLILIVIANIPVFPQNNSTIVYVESLSNVQQIFLLFLIHIWLDLSQSSQFDQATRQYNQLVQNREDVMVKCTAYQQNRDQIQRLFNRYQEAMRFQLNLRNALNIIDQWHQAMYKKKVPQFQNLKISKLSSYAKILQQEMKKQMQQRPQQTQITDVILNFLKRQTSVALSCNYLQIMRYIVFNNHRLIKIQQTNIDIWDYVIENYQILNKKVLQAELQLQKLTKVIQNQDVGNRMQELEIIKTEEYSDPARNFNEQTMGTIKTPKKIFINVKSTKQSAGKIVLYFLLSNFSYFLTFFIIIYYMINPCLLSLPLIIYFFSYEIISDYKFSSIMLLYIISIILLGLFIQIQNLYTQTWVKYLFFLNSEQQYSFSIGYLFFIFILIFINEEIRRYQGIKFKYPQEAESRLQGVFRMLVNQDNNSKSFLWNLKIQQGYDQKQQNPMQYFGQKIQNKPQQLSESQLPGFFQNLDQGKTGIDLYPFIAGIQIFLTIYIIFFYTFMTQNQYQGLDQTLKYFQFSSNMVIAVLVHVFTIVIQRRITLIQHSNKYKVVIKYWYTMVILAALLIFLYYLAPISYSVKDIYQPTTAGIIFAFFYFIYFFLSALQIKYGYKKYKSLNSFMSKRTIVTNLVVSVFTAIPFLYELKMMMDYSFTETSLQFFDWFKLFDIYYSAFKAKVQYYFSTGSILGNPQPMSAKFVSWAGFILILLIIFGPMILFSGLNPIAESNLITGGALQVGIQIQGGNFFGLYSTSHFSTPPMPYTPQQFAYQNFSQVPALNVLTQSDIPQQFQYIQFQPFSDSNWGISYPNFITLNEQINKTIQQLANKQPPSVNFSIEVKYQFTRRITQTVSADTNFEYPLNQTFLNLQQLQSLYNTLNNCNQPTFFPQFYISLIRLFTTGNTYKPRPINYTIPHTNINPYLNGIYLTLYCDQVNSTTDTNNVFWAVNATNSSSANPDQSTGEGIFMNVLCDKYQNLIAGLGFTALYTSVILVVAGFLRGQFQNSVPQLTYLMNPKPDNILQISQAIGTLRDRKQFRQQYLMYFQLIDIIRSPDLMKYLSGSYPAQIEEADEKRRKKEQSKEFSNNKNKID